VHLVPQGEIVITNMWGKVRGKIAINEQNTFGNVLPKSTRKFEFNWQGEPSPFEVGRYEALATLAYGADSRQTVYRSTYFWVVPMKPVIAIVGGLTLFIWFLMWSVRRYIRKALALEGARLGLADTPQTQRIPTRNQVPGKVSEQPVITFAVLRRPLVETSIDLRRATESARKTENGAAPKVSFAKWLKYYRAYIIFFVVLIIGFSLIGWYFVEVFQSERTYQVEQIRGK